MSDTSGEGRSQLDRFKEAARELETDDSEERFNDKLKKLAEAKHKASERDSEGD